MKKKTQYEFKCGICRKKFFEKTSYQEHKKTHNVDHPYQCKLCSYSGKTVKYLSRHVKRVHTEPTIPCTVCGKKFHFQCTMKEHMLVHTGAKPYKCKVCGKAFNTSYSLGTHNLIHEDRKPFQCSFCDYSCRDSSTLRKHKDRHMGKIKRYPCDLCNKLCTSNSALRIHVNEKHFGLNVYCLPCEICGKMFKTNATLTAHVTKVHARKHECKCEICGAISLNKANLQAHLRSHIDIRPYHCTFKDCDKKFKSLTDLKKHNVTHYPERHHPCSTCGRLFARKSRLKKHKLTQHKPKVKSAQCDLCGSWFFNKKYVAVHIQRKHGSQRYECDECGFSTRNKPSIVMHLKHGHNDNKAKKEMLDETEIKKEIENLPELELFEVDKEEILSDAEDYQNNVNLADSNAIHMEDADEPEEMFHGFVTEEVSEHPVECTEKLDMAVRIDKVAEENARRYIQELQVKSRREREMLELEETRQQYNKRMREAMARKPKQDRVIMKYVNNKECQIIPNNETESSKDINESSVNDGVNDIHESLDVNEFTDNETDSNDNEVKADKRRNGKLNINIHQCYVCFRLFETKPMLIEHCKEHFDVCSGVMLKKCPLCDYVTKLDLVRHMRLVHKVTISIPYARIKDKKHNEDGSRYYYEIDSKVVNRVEIIPSVRNLNKRECVKIDNKRREAHDIGVVKRRLVKKGREWVVETERVTVKRDYTLPEFDATEIMQIEEQGDDYVGRLKKLSRLAKKCGKEMLFPCESCEKICQTLSALRLHTRRHNPNAKPFKPKTWKRKMNGKHPKAQKPINKQTAKAKAPVNTENRYANPKPIKNKHKCDPELKEFYESNIKGGDIEFWQFLKIYNRMSRENITDFSDLNNRTDFGIHNVETPKEISDETEYISDKD